MPARKITVSIIVVLTVLFSSFVYIPALNAQTEARFSDVPVGHPFDAQIHRLRELNITQGVENNNFGMGRIIKRGEFVTFLVRLMGWEIIKPTQQSFEDVDMNHSFYGYIETALLHGVIKKESGIFRLEDPITREEMSIMIVRSLGYDTLAPKLDVLGKPFNDVTRNFGYITIGKDLGIIAGTGGNNFSPESNATREQAAAMMIRMYDKLNTPMSELHAFYAISSYSQIDKFSSLDSVSFGWARLEYDEAANKIIINTDTTSANEYYIPTEYTQVLDKAAANQVSRQLMFFIKDQIVSDPVTSKSIKLGEFIVTNPDIRKQAIDAMVQLVNSTVKYGSTVSFDGMVSDFEGFKGEALKLAYNAFLTELKAELSKTSKKLYVAVHPKLKSSQEYFDGYDYRTIGELADKVILMAHDYEAKSLTDTDMQNAYTNTPVTPFDEIYYALKSITDPVSGVQDRSKIWLQFSMNAAQWKIMDGKVIHREPYAPFYSQIYDRFIKDGVTPAYSESSQNAYAEFTHSDDGTFNVIWYENQRSIAEKIKLAKLFGIKGLSLWRLGIIPEYADTPEAPFQLNIWDAIMRNYQ